MKVVYVAGPIRAPSAYAREQNIRKAEDLALRIWQGGHVAVCPHSMTRFYGEDDAPIKHWLEGTLELLRRCDVAVFLFGWEDSEGSVGEYALAEQLEIPTCELRRPLNERDVREFLNRLDKWDSEPVGVRAVREVERAAEIGRGT